MKIRFTTVSKPNFDYAIKGFELYKKRISYYHDIKTVHFKKTVSDKEILSSLDNTFLIALSPTGKQFTSHQLADFLITTSSSSKEISFLVGGPEGLSSSILEKANLVWSLGELTLPHDLAMVVALEAIYRSTTIRLGLSYHK